MRSSQSWERGYGFAAGQTSLYAHARKSSAACKSLRRPHNLTLSVLGPGVVRRQREHSPSFQHHPGVHKVGSGHGNLRISERGGGNRGHRRRWRDRTGGAESDPGMLKLQVLENKVKSLSAVLAGRAWQQVQTEQRTNGSRRAFEQPVHP